MIHLVEGPVGAGKSTFAAALAERQGGVHLALDAWFARLYGPDRPAAGLRAWYVERKARCLEVLWATALDLVRAGLPVVLELGLIQRQARAEVYRRADAAGVALAVYVLDAPREVRRERVRRRNEERGATFAMVVPEAFFELASDLWEEPDAIECQERGVQRVAG